MAKQNETLEQLIDFLQQHRDELKLKLHLAKEEAKEEYDRLSRQIDKLDDQYKPVREAAIESAENVAAALKLAAEEMKNGLLRIGKSISESRD